MVESKPTIGNMIFDPWKSLVVKDKQEIPLTDKWSKEKEYPVSWGMTRISPGYEVLYLLL
jgi:hypothetical protein